MRIGIDDHRAINTQFDGTNRVFRFRRSWKRHAEAKTRSLTFDAVDPDVAFHQLDQTLGDRKAKPRAFELAVAFFFHLIEFAKDVVDFFLGNADARIFDRDVKRGLRACLDPDNADGDAAFEREFHRVADQVGQHLPQTRPVANKARRQEQIVIHPQRHALILGRWLKQHDHFVQQAFEIELFRAQFKLVRLDLGVIQNVIDDRQQRLARVANGFGIKPLFRRQAGVHEQFGHANHTIHRRANFMAHIRKERRLGPVGRFGPFHRGFQIFLRFLQGGDIHPQTHAPAV